MPLRASTRAASLRVTRVRVVHSPRAKRLRAQRISASEHIYMHHGKAPLSARLASIHGRTVFSDVPGSRFTRVSAQARPCGRGTWPRCHTVPPSGDGAVPPKARPPCSGCLTGVSARTLGEPQVVERIVHPDDDDRVLPTARAQPAVLPNRARWRLSSQGRSLQCIAMAKFAVLAVTRKPTTTHKISPRCHSGLVKLVSDCWCQHCGALQAQATLVQGPTDGRLQSLAAPAPRRFLTRSIQIRWDNNDIVTF